MLNNLQVGENIFQRKIKKIDLGGIYTLIVETPYEKATQLIIVMP